MCVCVGEPGCELGCELNEPRLVILPDALDLGTPWDPEPLLLLVQRAGCREGEDSSSAAAPVPAARGEVEEARSNVSSVMHSS